MRILLPVNNTKFSDAATQAVLLQASAKETVVHVVHVIDAMILEIPDGPAYYPGIECARDAQKKPAEALVAKTAELLRAKCLQVSTSVRLGVPKSEIIDAAAEWHADLIVIGSHRRTGLERLLAGSLSDAVLRHAHCSVEIARIRPPTKVPKSPNRTAKSPIRKVLLATDGSRFSEAALQFLVQQVRPHETEVRVLHVAEPLPLLAVRGMSNYQHGFEEFLDTRTKQTKDLMAKIAEDLRGKELKVSTAIVQGDPKTQIFEAAKKWDADLIVLGSLGRSGLERFLLGSVAENVTHRASCSVEIVRTNPGS